MTKEALEFDRELCQVSNVLDEVEKGMVATSMMGGNQARCEISKYNENITKVCDHCYETDSTADHIKRSCKTVQPIREGIDPGLAAVPIEYLPMNIRCGIAPAMKHNGKATYWGKALPEQVPEKVKKILGVDRELFTPGVNSDRTSKRQEALEIAEDPDYRYLNARQLILNLKGAHGSG